MELYSVHEQMVCHFLLYAGRGRVLGASRGRAGEISQNRGAF